MKRSSFLKLGLTLPFIGAFSFKALGSPEKKIKQNPVIEFTKENLSEFNVGTYVIRHKTGKGYIADVEANPNYCATVVWKLVYQLGYAVNNLQGEKVKVEFPKYGLCNVLTDGWTHWVGSKEELCDYLNNNPYGETYRILTKEELFYIIENRSNQKQIVRNVNT